LLDPALYNEAHGWSVYTPSLPGGSLWQGSVSYHVSREQYEGLTVLSPGVLYKVV